MQRLKLSMYATFGLAGAFALAGCAGPMTFDTSETFPVATTTMTQSIQGSNFGGHAPIVGAKVFLLQASTSGYGTKSTSLLTSAAGGTDTTIVGTSGSPAYYVTTDTAGFFNITGDYTCTAGLPVYLYAYAGAPDTNPSVGASNISSASASSATGNLVVTFVVDNEKFYVGQSVTFANVTGTFSGFSGTTQVVSAVSTTDNKSFSVTLGPSTATIASTPTTGTVSPIGVQNPGIVNVAMLGNCPSSATITGVPVGTSSNQLTGVSASDLAKIAVGETILGPGVGPGGVATTITAINSATGTLTMAATDTGGNGVQSYSYTVTSANTFGTGSANPINFVYVNEVSTAAAMFAMAPFAETSTISGGVVTRTGTDAQHIGIPASDSLALTGIQNAAVNAGQLYDIQGGNVGTGCSLSGQCADGEAHIARLVVPKSGTGYGVATVPEMLIDTLGNILAACVDSNNTYGLGATTGTASAQCKTLFTTATSNGVPVSGFGATTPTDTATAAINIAHYPGGNGQTAGSNAYVNALFGLQSGVVPFQPALGSAPTDFVIGINITVPQGTNPTNYLGTYTGGTPTNAIPTAIAAASTGEVFVGTTGCGSGGTESPTNGYGCVLQLEPYQLLPALPTVGGVGLAQGVKSISLGPSGKVWVTGTLETGQTVGGYTPPPGAFYVEQNTPSLSSPITYGTANGALSTSYNFASYGNVSYNVTPGTYTHYYGTPTAIALTGGATAYIADSSNNYVHWVTGIASSSTTPVLSYTSTNYESEYIIQGVTVGATQTQNCLANVTSLAVGPLTPKAGGAYNFWGTSNAQTATQGMCTIAQQATTGLGALNAQTGNTAVINTVTPISQLGPTYTPTSMAVDANDVGWVAEQSPAGPTNMVLTGFPDNGVALYANTYGFTRSATSQPTGVAIDGNNNMWVTNLASNSVSVYTNTGSPTTIAGANSGTVISPAGTGAVATPSNGNGGYTAGGTLSGPAGIAIDPSGDVWVINTATTSSAPAGTSVGYSVTELIGVAAPTYAPLSAAQANNKLGAKP